MSPINSGVRGKRQKRTCRESPETELDLFGPGRRRNWIRLRTLILLRWFAIAGQLAAIVIGQRVYELQLEVGLCFLAVGVSVIGNLVAMFVFPETKRLSEQENFMMVVFDVLQLCFLLFLTGGLHNPFSLLVLAPVTDLGGGAAAALDHHPQRDRVRAGDDPDAVAPAAGHLGRRRSAHPRTSSSSGIWIAITIALVFISVYARRSTTEMHAMQDALTATQMALARDRNSTTSAVWWRRRRTSSERRSPRSS